MDKSYAAPQDIQPYVAEVQAERPLDPAGAAPLPEIVTTLYHLQSDGVVDRTAVAAKLQELRADLLAAREEIRRLRTLVLERDRLNSQYAAELDNAENIGADKLLAALSRLGVPVDNWDGDDGLWPTLARCIVNYAAQRAERLQAERDAAEQRAEAAERREREALEAVKILSALHERGNWKMGYTEHELEDHLIPDYPALEAIITHARERT